MTDVEDGVAGKARAQLLDVLEPLLVEPVTEEAVPVVVDLVAEEDDPLVRAEDPRAVMGRLARPEIDDGELDAIERHALAVADRRVREDSIGGPVLSEHGTDDLILERIVGGDGVNDALRGVDGNIRTGDDLAESRVVVGMRMRHERGQERLPSRSIPARISLAAET